MYDITGACLCLLLLSSFNTLVTCELTCLSCTGVTSTRTCSTVQTCGNHSVCYTDHIVTDNGHIVFNMGCRDTMKCGIAADPSANTNSPVKLDHRRDGLTMCEECCNDRALCNVRLCSQPDYPKPHGPICYACDQQHNAASCNRIQVCGRDDACVIEKKETGLGCVTSSSCRSKFNCYEDELAKLPIVGIIGREINENEPVHISYKQSDTEQTSCCVNILCNRRFLAWSDWSHWSKCSITCGGPGHRQRTRTCQDTATGVVHTGCLGDKSEVDPICFAAPCKELTCLSCKGAISPRDCSSVEVCGAHSVCFTDEYFTNDGYKQYHLGCRDKLGCGVKDRRFLSNSEITCSECCEGNLCNSQGCDTRGYPSTSGPVCYSCLQQRDTSHCNTIQVCKNGESCFLSRITVVDTIYQSGCYNTTECISGTNQLGPYGSSMCSQCCNGNLCNTRMCEPQSTTALPTLTYTTSIALSIPLTTSTASTFKTPTVSAVEKQTSLMPASATTRQSTIGTVGKQTVFTPKPITTLPLTKGTVGKQTAFTPKPITTLPLTIGTVGKQTAFTPKPITTQPSTTYAITVQTASAPKPTTATVNRLSTHRSSSPQTVVKQTAFTNKPTSKPTMAHSIVTTYTTPQPISGSHMSAWGQWSQCSDACDSSFRYRTCVSKPCNGATQQLRKCGAMECPSDACCDLSVTEWTAWQPWGRCSETDSNKQGTRDRIKYCVNPTPKSVTKDCQYSSFDIDRVYCLGTNSTVQGCIAPVIQSIDVTGAWTAGSYNFVHCNVTGDPKPVVFWRPHTYKQGVEPYNNDPSTLFIQDAKSEYVGLFTCFAHSTCNEIPARMTFTEPLH